MSLDVILCLFEEIVEAIDLIKLRASDILKPDDFLKDQTGVMKLDSIAMRLQVIGEAIKKVDKLDADLLSKYPEIEWRKIRRMRDFISHHYNELDEDEVFTAVKYDLPQLEIVVHKIMNDINKSGIG